ncbi:hypothetical protein HAPAU_34010 [Halalkalicoccus paucihalophilus]|uniref:Sulfate exporter family transporter n=1 Tax=Halalkalicoccus paucihalophilus TaxID=1008153 RepID=A0A151A9N6_9EURY|nr:putative sulfate exporter family transporter [Halalkalicoccus paucihalophilus]KYH24418.1 hypothetical protein HAPAU_34010 [Halalkalicoccus paucihalophilus]
MPEGGSIRGRLRTFLPGVGILVFGAIGARAIATKLPGVNELLVAILGGVLLANVVDIPKWATPGIRTHKVWLGTGIVLMGASLAFDAIVESGPIVLLLVCCVTGFTLLYVEALSRNVFGITDQLASLLAAGASICGVSAVVAVAGSIDAREEQIAYAAATVLLFDAVTLVVYPAIGGALDLSARVFGVWAGVSMFSTGPVVAVGFAHSEAAGQWATITKLARNTLIGIVAAGYAAYYARNRLNTESASADDSADNTGTGESGDISLRELWDRFPKFVVGFLLLALVSSAGLFSLGDLRSIENAYGWLFLLAFVGLGTDLELRKLKCAGVRPVFVVFVAFATVSVLSLLLLRAVLG